MATTRIAASQVSDIGVTVVADGGATPVADIFFVHGIQGHPYSTWTFEEETTAKTSGEKTLNPGSGTIRKIFRRLSPSPPSPSPVHDTSTSGQSSDKQAGASRGVFWPGDILPNDQPKVRVLTCGYDSHVSRFFQGPTSQMNIHDLARNLLNHIVDERVSCPDRPIIFVAHSLGGILVKALLRISRDEKTLPRLQNPYERTFAIIFFGTPHRGSSAANWGLLLSSIAKASFFDVNKTVLRDLDPSSNSGTLATIGRDFTIMLEERKWQTATFRESQAIKGIPGLHVIVVPESSAVLENAKDNLQVLNASHMDMCRFTGRTDQKYKSFLAQLTYFLQNLAEVQQQVQAAETARLQSVNIQRLREIAQWLSSYPHTTNFRHALIQWFPGTCQGYLNSPICLAWRHGVAQPARLICQGDPGTGKSVLAAALVNTVISQFRTSDYGIAYLFCSYREIKDVTATTLLGSVTRQLLERKPNVPKNILELHENLQGRTPTHEQYLWIAQVLVRSFRVSFIVVDAIDECSETTSRELLSSLDSLGPNVRLFVTSRPKDVISLQYATSTTFKGDTNDFKAYLDYRMLREDFIKRYTRNHPALHVQVRDTIAEKADGMFLLVEHHFNALRGCINLKAVRKSIETVPTTVEATWTQTLNRIADQPPQYIELAYKILMFQAFDETPWDVLSLRCAVAVNLDDEEFDEDNKPPPTLLSFVCKGMVVLDSESQTIRLAHYSAREYLLRHHATLFPKVNASITLTYLHYLSTGPLDLINSLTDTSISWSNHPFATRSAVLWGEHARLCDIDNALQGQILHYLDDKEIRDSCAWTIGLMTGSSTDPVKGMSRLHLASYHGLTTIVQALLDTGDDVRQIDDAGRTPLSYAAQRGFQAVVDLLIKASLSLGTEGITPLADKADSRERTPLMWACISGSHEVVRALLSRDDVDAKREDHEGNTAFYYAARAGHADIVSSLLKLAGYDKDLFNKDGTTALIEAAEKGALSVVVVLLEVSANSVLRNAWGMTALHVASKHGHVPVIDRLINAEGGINERDNGGRTPLIHAAERGEAGAVERLMSGRADPNLQDRWKLTALHVAVISGHTNAVAALLGPDLNEILWATRGKSITGFGRFPHHKPHALRLDPNVQDAQGCTALHLAADSGKVDIVSWLLKHLETDIHALDHDERTPLARAAENGHVLVVNLLIQSRAKPYNSAGISITALGQWKEESSIRISTIHRYRPDSVPLAPNETIITREGMYETVERTEEYRADGLPWPSVWTLVGPAARDLEQGWIKQRKKVRWAGLATEWEWEYSYRNRVTGQKSDRRPPYGEPLQHSNWRGESIIGIPSSFSNVEYDDRPMDPDAQSRLRICETERWMTGRWMDRLFREQQRQKVQSGAEKSSTQDSTRVAVEAED